MVPVRRFFVDNPSVPLLQESQGRMGERFAFADVAFSGTDGSTIDRQQTDGSDGYDTLGDGPDLAFDMGVLSDMTSWQTSHERRLDANLYKDEIR
jgi:hypothetical protein